MMKVMTIPLFPDPYPRAVEGRFVGRGSDFHGKAPIVLQAV
jgi:hypothetical protein